MTVDPKKKKKDSGGIIARRVLRELKQAHVDTKIVL
jgi:hypothetical protein